ncbi:MAG TPA: MopE-related protein [Chitinophagales bacterium]|nr:MopE-related protein [Chitinophagales bacterium]
MPKPVLQIISTQPNGDLCNEYVVWGNNQELPHWRALNNLGSYGYNFTVQTRGNAFNQPLFVQFQDSNPFSKLDSSFCQNCNMLQLDDRLPNGQGTYWVGYNDSYNMYLPNDSNPIVTSGKVHTYSQAMTQAIIRWTKRQSGVDSNRIYMTGQSHNGFGCMLTAMNMPSEIACIYNVAGPIIYKTATGDAREHQFCLASANIATDIDYPGTTDSMLIWQFTSMRTYYRNNTSGIPMAQSANGKNDMTVGWIQKFHWYDSLNVYRQGGTWFWDQRTHGGSGANFNSNETTPNYTRYYSNRSYPAFAFCSINQNPGNGNVGNGDPYGAFNGYLDWDDNSITDQVCSYSIKCFVKNFYVGGQLDSRQFDSCLTDITMRRTQQFHPLVGQTINWTNYGAGNHLLQSGSFVYNGGLITLTGVKIKKTGSTVTLQIANAILTTYYADTDGDGYGDASVTVQGCSIPVGYVTNNTDCNDANAVIHPGTTEVCNGVDENCNGQIDEGVKTTFYADVDGDGYGNAGVTVQACTVQSGYVFTGTDCNDANAAIHPGATEIVNTLDDNCNGQIDELTTYYADADGDGYGNPSITTQTYSAPLGYVSNATDCNDANTNIHPNVNEVCNGLDDNCNGQMDEGVKTTFYADADGDSYGNQSVTTQACSSPAGYVSGNTDCNDAIAAIHPGATETCNAVDDNCNGQIDDGVKTTYYANADGDGYGNPNVTTQACSVPAGYVSNNTDCNDASAAVHPGATEVCNGVDDNCNGQTDDGVVPITVTPSGTVAMCSGNNTTLQANTGSGRTYQWQKNAANISGATASSFAAGSAGAFTVIVTSGTCTATSSATTINVNLLPTPTIATSTGVNTFCSNSGVYLNTTTAGYSYSWYKGSALVSGATNQNYTPAASGTYKVQISDVIGCTLKSTGLVITVNAAPAPTITGSTSICQGQSTTLSANTTYSSYSWSTGATTQSISVSTATTRSLTVTDVNGCSGTAPAKTTTINALPTPAITAAGPASFCSGGSVALNVTATYTTYNWSNGTTGQSHSFSASGSYFCTVTDINSCSGTSNSISVTVHTVPIPILNTSNSQTTFCSNSGVYLTTTTTGYSYSWLKGGVVQAGATSQNYTPPSSATYKVKLSDAFGCTALSSGLAVTRNVAPSPTITGSASICQGHSTTLSANATFPAYLWSTGATTKSISTSSSTTYTITVTDANGCTGTAPSVVTTVYSNPTAIITASGATDFCDGNNVILTASTASSYSWSDGKTSQANTVSTSGTFNVTITDAHGCTGASSSVTTNDHVVPVPIVTSVGPLTYCVGSPASYLTTSSNSYSYQWKKGTAIVAGATTQNYQPIINGTFKVQITDNIGCSKTSATGLVVTANSLPVASASNSGSTNLCGGATTTLIETTGSGNTYQWKNNGSNISGATGSQYTTGAAGTYKCQVTKGNGCSATSNTLALTNNCKIGDGESGDGLQTVINLYPNPAINGIHIDAQFASALNGEALLEIHNLLGEIVYSEKQDINGGKLSTSILFDQRFSNGSFFARISFNGDCIIKQFLVIASGK